MKLKKVVSLALAGVLAVSMLAGCKNDGSSSNSSSEPVVDSSLAGQVIANLAAKTTKYTTFSSTNNDHLELVLSNALEGKGTGAAATLKGSDLVAVDATLGSDDYLPKIEDTKTSKDGNDSKIQKFVFTVNAVASSDASAAYLLADKIDNDINDEGHGYVAYNNKTWDTLPEQSLWDNATFDDATYYWTFAYTADVAVEKVTDPTTGMTTYVAAVVVTRTPTKTDI